jgi:hypothetical protein
MRAKNLALTVIATTSFIGFAAVPSMAANEMPMPATSACSADYNAVKYACLSVNRSSAPAGQSVTFTGSLSKVALKNLGTWTKKNNIVCLTQAPAKPEPDGWPTTVLEGACTQVNKAGKFTITAEFGKLGLHFYGVEMGPCQGDAGLCGNGDPGLIGLERPRAVAVTTT